VVRPFRVADSPGPGRLTRGVGQSDLTVAAKSKLAPFGKLDRAVPESTLRRSSPRLCLALRHYAPLVGGVAGFGFFTFGGCFGVLSPMVFLRLCGHAR
jgi:hypothetical protein